MTASTNFFWLICEICKKLVIQLSFVFFIGTVTALGLLQLTRLKYW
jgi:hypothetical protein